jgi:hypothetical protein
VYLDAVIGLACASQAAQWTQSETMLEKRIAVSIVDYLSKELKNEPIASRSIYSA